MHQLRLVLKTNTVIILLVLRHQSQLTKFFITFPFPGINSQYYLSLHFIVFYTYYNFGYNCFFTFLVEHTSS